MSLNSISNFDLMDVTDVSRSEKQGFILVLFECDDLNRDDSEDAWYLEEGDFVCTSPETVTKVFGRDTDIGVAHLPPGCKIEWTTSEKDFGILTYMNLNSKRIYFR
jgi:hypothetical protein